MTSRSDRRFTAASGYSLVELLVALAVMGLIATVAVPMVAGTVERATLTADARALATRLRAWREIAMDRQMRIAVTHSAHRLSASHGDEFELSTGTSIDVANGPKLTIGPGGGAHGVLRLSRGGSSIRVAFNATSGRVEITR